MPVNQSLLLRAAFLILFFWGDSPLQAQTFFAEGGVITDFGGEFKRDIFPLEVKGLTQNMDSSFGLQKICISITHPRASDLKVELMSPDGTAIWLTNRNGGDDGQNYLSTCFSARGFTGYIHQGRAPFTGTFTPDGRFEFLHNGQSPNGYWYLIIRDLRAGESGQLNGVQLQFGNNPLPGTRGIANIENPASITCPPGKNCELLPDLVIVPRFTQRQVKEYAWNDPYYPGQLRLAATIANIGYGAMEIYGSRKWHCGNTPVDTSIICADGKPSRQRVIQKVFYKENGKIKAKEYNAGTLYYEAMPGHDHYHVDNWVEFRLVKLIHTSKKIPVRKVVAQGQKVSYCLFDTGICDSKDSLCYFNNIFYGEKNLPNYGLGNYANCDSKLQGISVGGYDTYGLLYEGQFIQLPRGLPKGWYYLEIEIDPLHLYKETRRDNNIYRQKVWIDKQ
jgi:hypothetical protein